MNKAKDDTAGQVRTGTAVRKRGKARVTEILATAQKILVQEGLAKLTTRGVANRLGISVGNLAYYYPSNDALLQAIIKHVIEGYDEEVRQEFRSFPDNPRERLKAFLRYLIDDAKKPEVRGFFYQFWGLATHNAVAAQTREEMYQHFTEQLLTLLRDNHPKKMPSELENIALGILACVEGLHVVFGSGDISRIHSRAFDKYMFSQLLRMVDLDDE
ncbi:MAG: AcrR family transcriptional regulator [Halieaceae bacterium]|jgi:AcrR family transcriptional regulator